MIRLGGGAFVAQTVIDSSRRDWAATLPPDVQLTLAIPNLFKPETVQDSRRGTRLEGLGVFT